MSTPRYFVALHHGESGTIATVIDRKRNRAMGTTSTMRDGAAFRQLADIQCRALNKRDAHKEGSK